MSDQNKNNFDKPITFGSQVPPAVTPILEALQLEDQAVQEEAAAALARLGKLVSPQLFKLVRKSPANSVRKYAARALGNMNNLDAVPVLVDALRSSDAGVRQEAAEALGKIGSTRALRGLIGALGDRVQAVREKVAAALDKLAWEPGDNHQLALYLAAKGLWKILPLIGEEAVAPLIILLHDDNRGIRSRAAAALGITGSSAAVEPIIEAMTTGAIDRTTAIHSLGKITLSNAALNSVAGILMNPDGEIRRDIAQFLEKAGWQPEDVQETALYHFARQDWSALSQMGNVASGPLVAGLKGQDPQIRRCAAEILGEIRDPRTVVPLLDAMDDPAEAVRNEAVTALGKIVAPEAAAKLLAAFGNNRCDELRVIEALGNLKEKAAVESLAAALTGKRRGAVRAAAARALGQIGDTAAVEALCRSLRDEDTAVRSEAARALGAIGDSRALEALLDAFSIAQDDASFREELCAAAVKIVSGKDSTYLINALTDNNSAVRRGAAEILRRLGREAGESSERVRFLVALQDWKSLVTLGKDAVEPLLNTLTDRDEQVRLEAVKALGAIGHPSAVLPLVAELKGHKGREVYEFAVIEALGDIGDVRAISRVADNLTGVLELPAKRAFEKIAARVSDENPDLFCTACFHRAMKYKKRYSIYMDNEFTMQTLRYYACRACSSNYYLVEHIETVILVLDEWMTEAVVYKPGNPMLQVNWFLHTEPFDYDEIWIKDADDYRVEEMVLKLRNDADDDRRKRLSSIKVRLARGLNLSAGKINLLKESFGKISGGQ